MFDGIKAFSFVRQRFFLMLIRFKYRRPTIAGWRRRKAPVPDSGKKQSARFRLVVVVSYGFKLFAIPNKTI